jgi:hypothetical protein
MILKELLYLFSNYCPEIGEILNGETVEATMKFSENDLNLSLVDFDGKVLYDTFLSLKEKGEKKDFNAIIFQPGEKVVWEQYNNMRVELIGAFDIVQQEFFSIIHFTATPRSKEEIESLNVKKSEEEKKQSINELLNELEAFVKKWREKIK